MRRKITLPCRIMVVGASQTGKTHLIRTLILRGDLIHTKKDLIEIVSPHKTSLTQPIWEDLKNRGYNLRLTEAQNFTSDYTKVKKPSIIIIDDADNLKGTKGLTKDKLSSLYCVESHHGNTSIVMITHKVRTGCPEARGSTNFIIFTGEEDCQTACREFGISKEITSKVQDYMAVNIPTNSETSRTALERVPIYKHIIISKFYGDTPLWYMDKSMLKGLSAL